MRTTANFDYARDGSLGRDSESSADDYDRSIVEISCSVVADETLKESNFKRFILFSGERAFSSPWKLV